MNTKKLTIHTIESLKARTIDDAGCWIWQGYYGNKTPHVFHDGKMMSVRRLFSKLLNKPFAVKGSIQVTCGHQGCVNPEHYKYLNMKQHMESMTKNASKSVKRAIAVQRYKRANHAKLTAEMAQEIRLSNESGSVLAQKYGVNKSLISRIRLNKAWVDLNHPFLSLMR